METETKFFTAENSPIDAELHGKSGGIKEKTLLMLVALV